MGTVLFSSGDVPAEVAHTLSTENSQLIEGSFQEKVLGLKCSEALCNAGENDLPRSFLGLNPIQLDKKPTSLEFKALVTYPSQLLRLEFTAKRGRYLMDCGHPLMGILLVGTAELETEDI